MVDVHDSETRSRNMAAIKSKNTKPELIIRRGLFSRGYRYRLHVKRLAGKPDLVLKKYNSVIFVHGCFWHLHDCHLCKMPKSRVEFWEQKLRANKERDLNAINALVSDGWRVIVVWECALKGKNKITDQVLFSNITNILRRPKEKWVYHLSGEWNPSHA